MVNELHGEILVRRVSGCDLPGDFEHVLTEERHPRGAVGLLQVAPRGQRRRSIENTDVVEAEKTTLENVLSEAVLAVHPPGEVGQKLAEAAGHELQVRLATQCVLHPIKKEDGKGMNRRVHVAEIPLVRRELSARVQVMLAEHQVELLLGEVRI